LINTAAQQAVAAATWGTQFRRPLYDSYCFSRIPATVRQALTGADAPGLPADALGPLAGAYDTVILLFVDAFGWCFIQEHLDQYPFLRRFRDDGVVSQLTAQFPSTTSAHVTTMHTGLPVGQHGLYEWFFYEPQLDRMIAPLLFAYAGDQRRDTLAATGIAPAQIYPQSRLYHDLAGAGVASFVLGDIAYARSPYSEAVCAGATLVPYRTLPEALTLLGQMRAAQPGKAYYYFYFDRIDSMCHQHGPQSAFVRAEIDAVLTVMERQFAAAAGAGPGRTLVLMTADHGHTAVWPAETVHLDRTLPALRPLLATDRRGEPLVPAGSPRDFFLHVRPDALDEAQALLAAHLAGRAEVHKVAEMMAQGFFGPAPFAPAFLGRVGNLVILPYAGETVWWAGDGRFISGFYGMHGGLTPEEMETVLLAGVYE
jgi:hypothetical protein